MKISIFVHSILLVNFIESKKESGENKSDQRFEAVYFINPKYQLSNETMEEVKEYVDKRKHRAKHRFLRKPM